MNKPYIGVTGFMSRAEVDAVLTAIPAGAERLLMIGVLVSSKTMQGIPNKWPKRYPSADQIAEIFPNHPLALNLVHFNTKDPNELFDQMMTVTQLCGENFHGFQLNIKWPNPYTLEKYKKEHPEKIIVLQCGESALEEVSCDPIVLASVADNYKGTCEYLLVDPSGGLGKPLNPYKGMEYLHQLNLRISGMGFGIAGGLSPTTLEDLMGPIAKAFQYTSIDAEGRLRDSNDNLDVAVAKDFVSKAYALFQ
ncbi:MAG TPA: hypothetical protein DEA43_03200 [Candidatus Moranbacteria bacterium]|nr:hypothetical protein [Candidatus Moranbacteria bacterium]HBI33792.1 hypothetical protein [Candidatus Moranbacteria bacterium]HBT45861.1 hypothetical protein [Candidatus Moranbacteria bacterium]